MSNTIAGHCIKCGAPYFMPTVWHGTCPPSPQPTCCCWNLPRAYTTTEITIGESNNDIDQLRAELEAARKDKNNLIQEVLKLEKEIGHCRSELSIRPTYKIPEEWQHKIEESKQYADELYEKLVKTQSDLEAAREEIEKLTVSRAEIADKQVILRKDLDEAQRYWDKCYRDLLESQSANVALKKRIEELETNGR